MLNINGIDLFCGAGGLTHGLQRSGITINAGFDIDEFCQYAYTQNNHSKFIKADITHLKSSDVKKYLNTKQFTLIAGCAPCQPFSSYTNKIKRKDEKWGLINQFLRIVNDIKPDIVTMENVPNLAKQEIFRNFVKRLKDIGYFVSFSTVYCPDYGIPQSRHRLVLLASKLAPINLIKPTHNKENYITVRDAISQLPPIQAGEKNSKDILHISSKHNYPRLIDEELFRIVQDTMEGRKRAPSKLYYGDKQYIFTGLVRCGCCGSLMTCETKVKDENHSYNYLKCNKLRSKCSQKPVNEAKILAQLENELCLPMDINDDMLKNIKSEVKKRLKEENINTANLKRDITIKLHDLDEQIKTLFRGYIQGKCDEKMYNELKTEIELEKEKLQKDMDRYLEIDTETDETLVNIAEIAANVGKFLKSPIISQKRDILNLILSDCKTERKNLCFSITKPFDKLLKTPEINKWCR